MIKFACPHCNRVINVKDEMAGKRGRCTGCKEPITVPTPAATKSGKTAKKPGGSSQDLEALAASLLAEPKEEAPADTRTVDFTCPYCDSELHLAAEFAGKQAPCPECRRILRVPQLAKAGPRDWRQPNTQTGPTGAKRQDVDLEGAWGTENKGGVSRAALVEADVIQEPREPWSVKQLVGIGAAVLVLISCSLAAFFWLKGSRRENLTQQGVQAAEQVLKAGAASMPPERLTSLHRLLGEYHHHAGTQDSQERPRGMLHLREARRAAALVEDLADKQALTRTLLRQGYDLGMGEEELGEILAIMPPGEFRVNAVRELAKQALTGATAEAAAEKVGLLRQIVQRGLPGQAVNPASGTGEMDHSEQLDCIGVVGLEAATAGQLPLAQQLVDTFRAKHKADLPFPAHFAALAIVARKPEIEPGKDRQFVDLGLLEAQLRQGNLAAAQDTLAQQFKTPTAVHLDAQLLVAAHQIEKGQKDQAAERLTKECVDIVERFPSNQIWPRQRIIELLVAAGKGAAAESLAGALLSERDQKTALARSLLSIAEGKLAEITGAASEDVLRLVPKDQEAYADGLATLARHNARADGAGTVAWAATVEPETARPHAQLGATLGLQDVNKK